MVGVGIAVLCLPCIHSIQSVVRHPGGLLRKVLELSGSSRIAIIRSGPGRISTVRTGVSYPETGLPHGSEHQFSASGELWVVGVSTIHTEVGLMRLVPPASLLGVSFRATIAKEKIGWEAEGGSQIPPSFLFSSLTLKISQGS